MPSSVCAPLASALLLAVLPCLLWQGNSVHPGYPPFSALGSPNDFETNEGRRQGWFQKLHGAWPPPKVYPGGRPRQETEAWSRRMDEIETSLRNLEDPTAQWEHWLDLGQMRLLANFTPTGWSVTEMDLDVHKEVSALYKKRDVAKDLVEGHSDDNDKLLLVGDRNMWSLNKNLPSALYRRLIQVIQRKLAEWVDLRPEQLSSTSAYGVRIYKRGSVLKSHVDHLETHVLSAVYCVDVQGEDKGAEPWYLGGFPDFTGEDAKVDLRPGQLFLYESAKLPHARPGVFHGESYAAMFVHFRPDFWDLSRFDRIYVLPPSFQERRRGEL